LAGGGQRGAFFVAHADPFDRAVAHDVHQWIEGIADQPEDLPYAQLLECFHQHARNGLSHRYVPRFCLGCPASIASECRPSNGAREATVFG